jgi:hypothetical protein
MFREMVHFVIDRGFSDPMQPEVHRSSTGSASSFEANYHLFPLRKVSMVCVVGDRDARWNIRAVVHRVHWTGRVGFESHGIDAFFWTLASGKFVQSLDDTFLFEVDRDGASALVKGITTRSPTLSDFLADGPTSTTSPMVSWPMTSPDFMPGMK